jgi:hypothetical protein
MLHRSYLGFPLVLLAASCVPPVAAHYSQSAPSVAPGFSFGAPGSDSAAPATGALPTAEVIAAAIAPGPAAKPFALARASMDDERSALDCLTAAVYYEARSESEAGQRAVAQVVLNRVRHPAFPKSVCGVVYQGSARSTGCQFSFTCDGSLGHRREPEAWQRAREVAENALEGSVYAPVGLATHYHTTAIRPWWAASMARAVTVGSHIFYRWHGEWGDPRSFRRPYAGMEIARASANDRDDSADAATVRERVFGVAVHRGAAPSPEPLADSESFGVRIHRSATPPPPVMVAEAEPPSEPVAIATR